MQRINDPIPDAGGVSAAVTIPAAEFALSDALAHLDDPTVEIERVVGCGDGLLPLVWITTADDAAEIDRALVADPSVASHAPLCSTGKKHLYRVEWDSGAVVTVVQIIVENNGVIQTASATAEGWYLGLLFPRWEGLAQVHDACQANGIPIELGAIRRNNEGYRDVLGLTRCQYDTLRQAYDHGLFEVPRRITTAELATQLGISHQALSERLRRAQRALVEQIVHHGAADADLPGLLAPSAP